MENEICCPYCGSTQLYVDKKGYSLKKGLTGMVLVGAVGLLGGLIGSNKIVVTCLSCGSQFNPNDIDIKAKILEQKVIKSIVEETDIEESSEDLSPIAENTNSTTDTYNDDKHIWYKMLEDEKKTALMAEFDGDYKTACDYWNMCMNDILTHNLTLDERIVEKTLESCRMTNNLFREYFTLSDLILHYPDHPNVPEWESRKNEVEKILPKPDQV